MKNITQGLLVSCVAFSGISATGTQEQESAPKAGMRPQDRTVLAQRKQQHGVDPLFVTRTSPRAMSGEPITKEQLYTLFEAARWAPSSYNDQPWVFIYALRGTPEWQTLFNLLVDFNQQWVKNAGALVVIVSRNAFEKSGKPNATHSFDTGAAWENLSLQGHISGLVIHGMAGFDYERAKKDLTIPDGYTVEAMFVVGKPGSLEQLPQEMRGMEKPSDRKPIEDFAFKGSFGKK